VFRTPRGKSTIATIPTSAPYDSFLRALLERAAETDRRDGERENDGDDPDVDVHPTNSNSAAGGCHAHCLKTDADVDVDTHTAADSAPTGNEQEHNVDLQLSRLSLNRNSHRSRNRNRKSPTSPSTLPYGYGRLVRRRTDVEGYIENRSDAPSSSIRNGRHRCGGTPTGAGIGIGIGSSAYISSDDDSTMGMDVNMDTDMEVDMDTESSDVNFSHLAYVVLGGKILGRSEYLNLTAKHSGTDSGADTYIGGAGSTCATATAVATAAPITHHISLIVRLRGGMVDRQNRVGSKFGGGGVSSGQQSERERKERLRQLALETVDLAKDPYLMRNHLGTYECKLCLTLHTNEG
jgi:hypothetical protein